MDHPPPGASGEALLFQLRDLTGGALPPGLDGNRSATAVLDPAGTVVWSDGRHLAVTGEPAPRVGECWLDRVPAALRDTAGSLLAGLADPATAAQASPAELAVDEILPSYQPDLHWLRIRLRSVRHLDGRLLTLAQLVDLTGDGAASLTAEVISDPLTGLYNRRAFLLLAASAAPATDRFADALVVEIRRFRQINEVWGSAIGDRCLTELARWFGSLAGPGDVLFRLGGAKFLMLLQAGSPVAASLNETGQRSVRIGYRELQLSVQAGWARRTAGLPLLALAEQAETALTAARRQAWRTVVGWTGELAEQAARAAAAEEAVQQAVTAGAESVYFQPVVDVVGRRVSAVEALVRLGGPAGQLATDVILAASHKLGLTPQFAERVFELAFTDGLRLRQVFPDCLLHINISREFLSTGLAIDTVLGAAGKVGVPLDQVVVELTEEVATGLPERLLLAELGRAAEVGLRLAIDDFGRGETSLSLLRTLPLSVIKLDRSLLPDRPDEHGWEFVAGVVSLLGGLTDTIVAEGIETAEQSRRLLDLGVRHQQGFLFSEPRPPDGLLADGLRWPLD